MGIICWGLINDILDFSEVQTEKLHLTIVPAPVAKISKESVRMIEQMANQKDIKVSYNFNYLGDYVQADPLRLKQILVNLLDNAVKFTPEGKEIGLKVAGSEEEKRVSFTVWDTGAGIEPDKVEQLFEQFVQADNPLIRSYGGAGLGLSLVPSFGGDASRPNFGQK